MYSAFQDFDSVGVEVLVHLPRLVEKYIQHNPPFAESSLESCLAECDLRPFKEQCASDSQRSQDLPLRYPLHARRADILPLHLELDKACRRVAVRTATLPHTVTKICRRTSKRSEKRHKSPLHGLSLGDDEAVERQHHRTTVLVVDVRHLHLNE